MSADLEGVLLAHPEIADEWPKGLVVAKSARGKILRRELRDTSN